MRVIFKNINLESGNYMHLNYLRRFSKDFEEIKRNRKELSATLDNLFHREELKLNVPRDSSNMTVIRVSIAIR